MSPGTPSNVWSILYSVLPSYSMACEKNQIHLKMQFIWDYLFYGCTFSFQNVQNSKELKLKLAYLKSV